MNEAQERTLGLAIGGAAGVAGVVLVWNWLGFLAGLFVLVVVCCVFAWLLIRKPSAAATEPASAPPRMPDRETVISSTRLVARDMTLEEFATWISDRVPQHGYRGVFGRIWTHQGAKGRMMFNIDLSGEVPARPPPADDTAVSDEEPPPPPPAETSWPPPTGEPQSGPISTEATTT
jgi:hypothetical protein